MAGVGLQHRGGEDRESEGDPVDEVSEIVGDRKRPAAYAAAETRDEAAQRIDSLADRHDEPQPEIAALHDFVVALGDDLVHPAEV
jgi:hypothetical protein